MVVANHQNLNQKNAHASNIATYNYHQSIAGDKPITTANPRWNYPQAKSTWP
jgi:hypothetical protein